ncbi:MAG: diguanylate cyclase [Gemmatimonadales bacterium]|nr:MAG: diguanylate cyclase [Gemmatimonadales bacterium]
MTDLDEGFQELQAEYLAEVPNRLAELRKDFVAIGAGDTKAPDSLARKFHQLAGSGGSYGFPEISAVAREAEQFIRGNPTWNAENLEYLDGAIERLGAVVAAVTGPEEGSSALAMEPAFRGHVAGRPGELRDAVRDILTNAGLGVTTDGGSVDEMSRIRDLSPSQWPDVLVIVDQGGDGDIDPFVLASAWSAPRVVRPQGIVLIHAGSEGAGPGAVPGVDAIFSPEQARSELPAYVTTAIRTGSPPLRVLLIEADLDQAQLMTGWLETGGVQVVHVGTAAQARPILRGESLDMVVLDVTLPDADGLAFAREIERHQPWAHRPVLLLAGQADIAQHLEALRTTGDVFLTKPMADREGPFLNLVLTRAERGRQLRAMAYRDSLTGLLNHATLMVALEHVIAHARRRGTMTALLIIGLNDLEGVNARHGHLRGDQVLAHAATVLRGAARGGTLLGRVTGTTLGVISLPKHAEDADVLARHIQAAFEAHPLDRSGEEPIGITASVGIACSPGVAGSAPAMLEAAKHALARAQGGGGASAPPTT